MSNALELARTHLAELREELAAAIARRPRRPPGLPGRPARGDGAGPRRVHRGRRQRDRVVPRAAQRPAGRLAAVASSRGTSASRRDVPPRKIARSTRRSIRSPVSSRWRSFDAEHRLVAHRDHEVLGAHAGAFGRRARDHLDDLDAPLAAERRGDGRRQRPGAAGDADPGAPHAAVAHQRRHDLARRRVDRAPRGRARRRRPRC